MFEKDDGPRSLYEEADRYLRNAERLETETHDEESTVRTRLDQAT